MRTVSLLLRRTWKPCRLNWKGAGNHILRRLAPFVFVGDILSGLRVGRDLNEDDSMRNYMIHPRYEEHILNRLSIVTKKTKKIDRIRESIDIMMKRRILRVRAFLIRRPVSR
jgi:hypothetical protein